MNFIDNELGINSNDVMVRTKLNIIRTLINVIILTDKIFANKILNIPALQGH